MIKFRCPSCDKKISVPPDYATKKVKCPRCSVPIRVPQPQTDLSEDFIPEANDKPADESAPRPADSAADQSAGKIPEQAKDPSNDKPSEESARLATEKSDEKSDEKPAEKSDAPPASPPKPPEQKPNIPKLANAIELEVPDEFLDSPSSANSKTSKNKKKEKCPHCRAPVRAGVGICITCGSQLNTVYLKAYAAAAAESAEKRKSASPKAILTGGIIGTLVGVIVWFAIIYLTHFKYAIPCIVGITSALGIFVVAREGTEELGKMAAWLTGAGLLLGTLALTLFMPLPTVSQKMDQIPSEQYHQMTNDNAAMYKAVCCDFVHNGKLDQNTADLLIAKQKGQTPPPQQQENIQQADEQVRNFLNSRTPKGKIDLARQYHCLKTENYLNNISIIGRFREFISILDFVWYFLAIFVSKKISSELAKSA